MITIDGSFGEGGGQIVRYGVALAALTQTPIEIINIRAYRPKPGLQPQHLTAVSLVKHLCNAHVTGLSLGSSKITFIPDDIQPGEYVCDIGTAGSITLVFQACLLSILHTSKPITIRLTGGSDVPWSPSWDYFTHVFLKNLEVLGISIDAHLERRGYYPTGNGLAHITMHPVKKIHAFQQYCKKKNIPKTYCIYGNIHCAHLPDHIAKRMKHTVIRLLLNHNQQGYVSIEKTNASSPGIGITLWTAHDENKIVGSSVLGEKKISAEQVATKAYTQLHTELTANATVDAYAFDQLLPYLIFAEKPSYGCIRTLTSHATTMIWLIRHFFDIPIQFEQQKDNVTFCIH